MSTVHGNIIPLRNNILVRNLEKGEQKTKGGIILRDDDAQAHGIRARWARIYRVGKNITSVKEGQWVYIDHGRWGRGVQLDTGEEKFDVRLADEKDILLVSDDKPENIYG